MSEILRKLGIFTLLVSLFLVATGCGEQLSLPNGMTPEEVIIKGFENAENVTKGVFEVDIRANLSGDDNMLNGSVDLDGTFDEKEKIMLLSLDVNGTMDEESVKAALELRVNKDGSFLNIGNLEISDPDIQEAITESLKDYFNKWVKLGFVSADDLFEASEDNPFASVTKGEDFNPFMNVVLDGTLSVLGAESYRFKGELDEEKVVAQMKKEGTYDSDVQEAFDAMEFVGEIYVSVDGLVLTGISGTATFDDPDLRGTVDFTYIINPTRVDSVTTPDYDEEITGDTLEELMFGGGLAPVPEPMFDDAELEDLILDEEALLEFEEAMQELENL